MAVSVREMANVGVQLSDAARAAVRDFASRIWEVREVRLVFGYMEDGWLVAVAVGSNIEDEQRNQVFQIQREMRRRYPDFDWGFRLSDQGDLPYVVPDFEPDEVIVVKCPRTR